MKCRHCATELQHVFLDLGFAPPSNAYLTAAKLRAPETTYPLKLFVCNECWLVQTEDYAEAGDLFSHDYAYFSSTSKSWLDHSARYVEMITERLGLTRDSFVIEIASNDGYLLKNFVGMGVPCLGVEPTHSTADAAEKLGVPVLREFFGVKTAGFLVSQGQTADLICGNNVYAHVPDINDFTRGLKTALKKNGTITLEFPHLMRLIEQNQFDTVYHEHFSYLSLIAVQRIFKAAGLRIWDVEELSTHGGSLRVYGCHAEDERPTSESVEKILDRETSAGLGTLTTYKDFQSKADKVKDDFVAFLIEQKRAGKTVAAYGAAAKGNTLLNYGGVKCDLVAFVCDAAPSKQDKFMPGSHLPIMKPSALSELKPDFVVILPWNIAPEVRQQQKQIADWGGQFVTAVPQLTVMQP
ncbi:class I SAM-dependent methyltransferase [Rhizobium sp. IBUN]|uniref:class I SAM-dependent methyltransferase n=1 Tax=Rhizobium sp. IBUN TaxID=1042326 RepID=UPI00040618DB|nr:class I SAM-dependent methyltransferase [Rhizobium sp. IBUN]